VARVRIDKSVAEPLLKRIEALEDRKDDLKAKCKEGCDEITADQVSVYEEAEAAGIPKRALKGLVKERKLAKKIKEIDDEMSPEEQAAYVGLVEALGEFAKLPLGKAALKRAEGEARPH
jgi:uncharacterized protein (UPF0335 family)